MCDFEWRPLVKLVGPAEDDVSLPPNNANEPSGGGGDLTDARVDLPRASDVVEVTPDVPPSMETKRKRNKEVGGTN